VAVVGLHPGAPVDDVAQALVRGLSGWLRVATLHTVGADGLERAERDHDRVLLVAPDPASDPQWWASAVRQADAVVAVAAADSAPPERTPLPPGADVVLVGPGTPDRVAWSSAMEAWQVTAVDRPDVTSLDDLAARLAGRSLGLVLAGGGARAFAHIGVLVALEEAGVRVDRVAGTSVGGIVAALHAMGWSAGEVRERAYAEFVRGRPFSDYTLPLSALAKGQRMRRALTRHFGGVWIEGMPRQFRCVSTDLLAREPVVHRRGEVVPALMATAALPGLLPPVQVAGRLHVDGGVLDNLPVGALTERGEGPVVAVNIAMGGGSGAARAPAAYGAPSPAGAPRTVRTPALGETILRTMLIGSGGAVQAAHQAGALVLTPSTAGAGLLEFHQFDTVVEAGLAAGRRLVEEGAELLSGRAAPR
jgi:predicted acylesterase/phospholipase RssA